MNVIFAFDGKMLQPLAVALVSLFETHADVPLNVVFIEMDVPAGDRLKIELLCRNFPNVQVAFQTFSIDDPARFPITGHISLAAYIRVFLADILPATWTKALYLDCDLIVRSRLTPIWEVDLSGFAIGAVREPGNSRHADLGMPPSANYINSGLLLVNLAYWREKHVKEDLLSFITRYPDKLVCWDQDAINACLHDHVKLLPDKWNVTHPFYLGPYRSLRGIRSTDLLQLQRSPAVVHFSGPTKPWMYIMTHPFQEAYWELLQRTPFWPVSREKRTIGTFFFRQARKVYRSLKRVSFFARATADQVLTTVAARMKKHLLNKSSLASNQ